MSFWLAIVVSSNPINFINVDSLHQQPARLKIRIDEVEWISAHNYGKPNDIHSRQVLAEKVQFWTSTLPHKMCPRKQTTEP